MVALFEALTWARALDEALGEDRPGRPEILKAVRFARNRALHGLVLLVEREPRDWYSDYYRFTTGVLTWVHSDQIDRAPPEHLDEQGMHAFEVHFQTRPVLDTMRDLDRALVNPDSYRL
jgi:hypothetical protein